MKKTLSLLRSDQMSLLSTLLMTHICMNTVSMSESEINSLANGDYFSCLDQIFPSILIFKLNRLIHTYIQIHKNYRIGKYWTVQRVCKGYLPGDPNNNSRCTSSGLCLSSVALNCFQVKIVCTFGSPIVLCIFYVFTF